MSHTPEWLGRKYKQMQRERLAESRSRVIDGSKSLALIIDAILNGGEGLEDILPPTLDELLGKTQAVASQYVTTQWWTPEKSEQ